METRQLVRPAEVLHSSYDGIALNIASLHLNPWRSRHCDPGRAEQFFLAGSAVLYIFQSFQQLVEHIRVSATSDQRAILQYLYRRLAMGDTRYCTIPTIRKNTGLEHSNQYILALTDDLETAGLVITRQAYQTAGGRLFQITAAGFDAVRKGEIPARTDSAAWTGRFNLSEHQKSEIRRILEEMRLVITSAKLSNARTANAMALIECAEKLLETPDPLWPEVMRLLRSPTLAGVTGIAGLVVMIVQIVIAAASS